METKLKECFLNLTSATTKGYNFAVYKDEDKTKIKYNGTISKDHKDDSCECMGNTIGLVCYHTRIAHSIMDGFWP